MTASSDEVTLNSNHCWEYAKICLNSGVGTIVTFPELCGIWVCAGVRAALWEHPDLQASSSFRLESPNIRSVYAGPK